MPDIKIDGKLYRPVPKRHKLKEGDGYQLRSLNKLASASQAVGTKPTDWPDYIFYREVATKE